MQRVPNLLERIGKPLEWQDVDKALLTQALQVPWMIGSFGRASHAPSAPRHDACGGDLRHLSHSDA